MSKTKTQQQTLPFAIEGNLANRGAIREISKNADYMRKVDISLVRIRPDNFNARIKPIGMSEETWNLVLLIPDLADKIWANNGPADSILGDFHTDGYFYQTNGERRIRAIRHLIKTGREIYPDGNPVSDVLVILNPPGTTDLERKKKMYATNDNLPFTPMQKAHYFASFKAEPYNFTHEQIAEEFKVSRQTIDNYVLATTLPADVQDKIDSGEVKISNALEELRAGKKKNNHDLELLSPGQEYHKSEDEKEKEKLRGDEEEFDQQDNSITSAGSKGGPKEGGSGAIVVGKDSIYMNEQKKALWKQTLNRIDVLKDQISINLPEKDAQGKILSADEQGKWAHNELIDRLMNEFDLTVK